MYISDLILTPKHQLTLDDLILDESNRKEFIQLIKEHIYVEELHRYGLPVNNKVLLYGSSGCGKTAAANAIATGLGKNLMILNLSNIICARIGETAQNIKMVFDKAAKENAVLFLDEFDQIGKLRSLDDKDVGEMRRLVNTMIQLMDYFPEKALLICATNHQSFLDPALLRRFQLRVGFSLPSAVVLDAYYDQILAPFPSHSQHILRQYDVSFAEAKDYAFTTVKSALIKELETRDVPMDS